MATQLKTILNWFKTGLKPTEFQFKRTFESFWHKSDKIPVDNIDGLEESLDLSNKADLVNGIVPAKQLPNYVSDVIEGFFVNNTTFNSISGDIIQELKRYKIYIDINKDQIYRWSGSRLIKFYNEDQYLASCNEYEFFVFMGQSNMVGFNEGPILLESLDSPDDRICEISQGIRKSPHYFESIRPSESITQGSFPRIYK